MKDSIDRMYLTPAERLVMRTIGLADHELVLHELLEICNESYNKDWKPQTVSTYLSHLVQKGYLKMRRQGRYCYYEPIIDRDSFLKYEGENFAKYWQLDVKKLLEFVSKQAEQ